jgi:uncharacterized protein YecE (DUF72 family)
MIRLGSCSWTEKTLVRSGEFYPKGVNTAEKRLRYYASIFDSVEVDSTYYAIPPESTVAGWAERTPPHFTFHVKAYAPLTGHGTDLRSLPPEVRDMLSVKALMKDRITIGEKEPLLSAFRLFREALGPLVQTNKISIIVFQYPPFFIYKHENLDYILSCKEMMGDFRIGVEFRHGSWLLPERRDEIFSFLRKHGITYITADEPQFANLSTVPFLPQATTEIAYFRLHGRNRENWFRKGVETSLRYDYLYSDEELKDIAQPVLEVSKKSKETFVMFNNCHAGFSMNNAMTLRRILQQEEKKHG